ncbi:hypothetical protein P3T24_004371 [Paraburkholderia sp. GAS33]
MSTTVWTSCLTPPRRSCAVRLLRINPDGTNGRERRAIWRPTKAIFEHHTGRALKGDLWAPVSAP